MVMRRAKDVGSEEKEVKAFLRAEEAVMPDCIVQESGMRGEARCVRQWISPTIREEVRTNIEV